MKLTTVNHMKTKNVSKRKLNTNAHKKRKGEKKVVRTRKFYTIRRRLVTWQRHPCIFLGEIGTKSTHNQMKGYEMVTTESRIPPAELVLL